MTNAIRTGTTLAATISIGYALVVMAAWSFGLGTLFGWMFGRLGALS